MSRYDLTKTVLRQGVWQGVLTAKEGADTPQISVTHEGKEVTDITLEAEGSEGSAPPRVKQEYMSDAGTRVKLKRHVEQRGPMEIKRKAAVAAPEQEELVARAAPLAKEGKRGIFGRAVFQERDAEAASDSSSYSYIASGASLER